MRFNDCFPLNACRPSSGGTNLQQLGSKYRIMSRCCCCCCFSPLSELTRRPAAGLPHHVSLVRRPLRARLSCLSIRKVHNETALRPLLTPRARPCRPQSMIDKVGVALVRGSSGSFDRATTNRSLSAAFDRDTFSPRFPRFRKCPILRPVFATLPVPCHGNRFTFYCRNCVSQKSRNHDRERAAKTAQSADAAAH